MFESTDWLQNVLLLRLQSHPTASALLPRVWQTVSNVYMLYCLLFSPDDAPSVKDQHLHFSYNCEPKLTSYLFCCNILSEMFYPSLFVLPWRLLLLFSFSFDSPSPVPVTWSSTWRVSGFLVLVNLPLSLRLTSSMSHFSTTAKTSCLRGALLSCGCSGLPQSANVSHSTCDCRSSVPDFCLLVFLSTSCRHTNRDKTLSMYRGKKNFSCTWYAKESFSSTAM